MPLESANFIDGLVITNPPGTDLKSQGDDHLQLIKKVLKNTFPGATRAFPLPTALTKTASYSVAATDQNSLIVMNHAAPCTLTMPALGSTDAGWSIRVVKLPGSVGPVFINPPSGTIVSGQSVVARARRGIPGIPFEVIWTGSNWIAQRCAADPVGSCIPFFGIIPTGYEMPTGQTLNVADYPEYAQLASGGGVTPDLRERSVLGSTLGGAAVGRINPGVSGINPASIGSGGGAEAWPIGQPNLPPVNFGVSGSCSVSVSGSISGSTDTQGVHHHGVLFATAGVASGGGTINSVGGGAVSNTTDDGAHAHNVSGSFSGSGGGSISGSAGSGGSGVPLPSVQPVCVLHYALVVE